MLLPPPPSHACRGHRGGRPRRAALPRSTGRRSRTSFDPDRASRSSSSLPRCPFPGRSSTRDRARSRRWSPSSPRSACRTSVRRFSSREGLQRRLPRRELEQLLPPSEAREFRGRRRRPRRRRPRPRRARPRGRLDGRRRARTRRGGLSWSTVSSAETIVRGGPGALPRRLRRRDRPARGRGRARSCRPPASRPGSSRSPSSRALADRVRAVRRLTRPRPPSTHRTLPRASLTTRRRSSTSRGRRCGRLYSLLPGGRATEHPARPGSRPRRHRGIRRHALGRARRGAAPRGRAPRDRPRRAGRRARPRRAVDRPPLPARAAEPAHGGGADARIRLATVARRVPGRRGRNARARPLADPLVRARGPRALSQRMFDALAAGGSTALGAAEDAAGSDARALEAYRSGRACHPLLPYADWAGCRPALSRLGRVVAAGAATPPPRARSASSRATPSRARSRWRTASRAGGLASASCSRRRTRRSSSAG